MAKQDQGRAVCPNCGTPVHTGCECGEAGQESQNGGTNAENPEVRRIPEQGPEFFENSILLDKAYRKYLDFENGKIDAKELGEWLKSEDGFATQDNESFNCHSFLLSIMKNDLGVSNIDTFEDVYMDKKKWIDKDGNMDDELEQMYLEHVTEEFPNGSDERMKNLRILQKNVLKNSKKFALRDLKEDLKIKRKNIFKNSGETIGEQGALSDEEYDKLYDEAQEKYQELVKEFDLVEGNTIRQFIQKIMEGWQDGKTSRFVFLFDETDRGELSYRDTHSFIILGVDNNKEDLVVLQKGGPGDSVSITTLSQLIKVYSAGEDLILNIPNKEITELYPSK